MEKVDLKKEFDAYRARRNTFTVVDVPDMAYLMIDGAGDPNTSTSFADGVQALYSLAYALKFASKADLGRDYVVMPLEGLWWATDMDHFTASRNKSRWLWTLMIMTPDWIGADMVGAARAANSEVRLERLSEGTSVQTLHVGTFDDEAPVLERMHRTFIPDNGLTMTGKHHEIYLSDVRRTAPEKRRTILRQPVEPR